MPMSDRNSLESSRDRSGVSKRGWSWLWHTLAVPLAASGFTAGIHFRKAYGIALRHVCCIALPLIGQDRNSSSASGIVETFVSHGYDLPGSPDQARGLP